VKAMLCVAGVAAFAAVTLDPVRISRWFIVRDLEKIGVTRPMFHCSLANDLTSVEFGPRINSNGLARYGSLFSLDLTALTHPDDDLALITDVDAGILILDGSPLSDAGIAHIARMPEVDMLLANDTQLTDASIEPMAEIDSLSCVFLTGTNVTMEGVERLQILRPDLHVEHKTIGIRIKSDEPSVATEPGLRGSTNGQSTLPAR
jgi:hypothetical protein